MKFTVIDKRTKEKYSVSDISKKDFQKCKPLSDSKLKEIKDADKKEEKVELTEEEVKSLTQAINDAIALYLKEIKRRKYAEGMMEAAKDPDFIKENEQIEKEFDGIDAEVEGEW